jgi:ribonuclease VapC
MVLDTSALLALLLDEPEAEAFRAAVEEDTTRLVSSATLLETALVIEARKGEPGGREPDTLIQKADVVVVPVDAEHVAEARRTYRRFGKGRHVAGLNYGDLLAYALARTSGEPLLFKIPPRTSGPTGCRRKSKLVTMPNAAAAAHTPEKVLVFGCARPQNRPPAVTTSTDTRLSHDSPTAPISHPRAAAKRQAGDAGV